MRALKGLIWGVVTLLLVVFLFQNREVLLHELVAVVSLVGADFGGLSFNRVSVTYDTLARVTNRSRLAVFGPMLQHAQPLPGTVEETFQQMARHHKVWLINGSMYERREGGIYNTTSIIDPEGEIVGRYSKMFPFTPLEQGVQPGTDFFVWDIEGAGRFGILNCYDMWFPETSPTLMAMGAEVILHPVMTHAIDRDLDLAVAHASSAMMQCYIFDINGLWGMNSGK